MTGARPSTPFAGKKASLTGSQNASALPMHRPLIKLGGVSKKPGSICICAQPKRAEGAISTLCDDGRLRTLL